MPFENNFQKMLIVCACLCMYVVVCYVCMYVYAIFEASQTRFEMLQNSSLLNYSARSRAIVIFEFEKFNFEFESFIRSSSADEYLIIELIRSRRPTRAN